MPMLTLHPDRLFPVDPGVRSIARGIYEGTRNLPIVSPHGHVEARLLHENEAFPNPANLLIAPDHYVTRLMQARGVDLSALGVGQGTLDEADARRVWRIFCDHWPVFLGTAVHSWLSAELVEVFGVTTRPSSQAADDIFDQIADRLQRPEFLPRALFERFGIQALATTDDPCDDLASHEALAQLPGWEGRVRPTFRPDRYLEPSRADWPMLCQRLAEVTGADTSCYPGWIDAMEARRAYFKVRGAVSTDHSHADTGTEPLSTGDADRIYRAALRGVATQTEAVALRRHMLLEQARMAADDHLVMTIHPAVRRNHHRPTFERFGPDVGADLPLRGDFVDPLRPMLDRFGHHPNFTVVLFTIDETTFSRELAPLAGFYPSVYVGAPWWFLDEPDAILRWRSAITGTAGFRKTSGFIDDTRAFCSIPARHDMSRRLDAAFLARLVAEHRMDLDEAIEVAVDQVVGRPTEVFHL
jgi:glucuronate isomerase